MQRKGMLYLSLLWVFIVFLLFKSDLIRADDVVASTIDDVVATVDGHEISTGMLNLLSASREHGLLSGGTLNRESLLDDLITTELLFQRAQNLELDKDKKIALELELAHKTLLSQLYVARFLDEARISDDVVKTTYDQLKPDTMVRMALWEFDNKHAADEFLADVKPDKNPEIAADEEYPWQRFENLMLTGIFTADGTPRDSQVETKSMLSSGQWSKRPMAVAGVWQVWRCLESSVLPKPAFEHARESIRQQLASEALQDHIAKLRDASVIKLKLEE